MQKLFITISFVCILTGSRCQSKFQPGFQISSNITELSYDKPLKGISILTRAEVKIGKKKKQNFLRIGISLNYSYYSNETGKCITKQPPNSAYAEPFKPFYVETTNHTGRGISLPIEFKYKVFNIKKVTFSLFHGISFDLISQSRLKQSQHYVDSLCNRTSETFEIISDWYRPNGVDVSIVNGLCIEYKISNHFYLQTEALHHFYVSDDDCPIKFGLGFKYIFD